MKVHLVVDEKGLVHGSGPAPVADQGEGAVAQIGSGPGQTLHELDLPDADYGTLSPIELHERLARGEWKKFADK